MISLGRRVRLLLTNEIVICNPVKLGGQIIPPIRYFWKGAAEIAALEVPPGGKLH